MRWLLLLLLTACSSGLTPQSALDQMAPPAVVNPYVVKRVPLCTTALTDAQRLTFQAALDAVNEAFPFGGLTQVAPRRCLPFQPTVRIDPEFQRGGYTVPSLTQGVTITLKSDNACVMRHELIHYLGVTKHANAETEPPGAMTDGDRGACLPSAVDVALLVRAYTGKPSW